MAQLCGQKLVLFVQQYVVVLTRGTNFLGSNLGLATDWDQFIAFILVTLQSGLAVVISEVDNIARRCKNTQIV
jgi:hypothetical protein